MTKRLYKITQGAYYVNENGKKKVYQAGTDNDIVAMTDDEAAKHPHLQLREVFIEGKFTVNPAKKKKDK
jgi:hypothetical protein